MTFKIKLCQKLTMSAVFLLAINTCSGDPKKYGRCEIDCSSGIVATDQMVIQPLLDEVSINCNGSINQTAVEASFLVSAQKDGSKDYGVRSNILVDPLVTGSYDPSKDFHENPLYKGIETPTSEWCSDKCGVVRISLWVECRGGVNLEHQIGLQSGPIVSDFLHIKAESPAPEGEESPEGAGLKPL